MDTPNQDIYANYECLRNDKTQERFIQVLDIVRDAVDITKGNQPGNIENNRTPIEYFAALFYLADSRIAAKEFSGLSEILRLMNIALGSISQIDSSIAIRLIESLVPMFDGAQTDLMVNLCPCVGSLLRFATPNKAMLMKITQSVCIATLSDDARLRKAASTTIYDTEMLHNRAFVYLFQNMQQNQLRAMTILKNLAYMGIIKDWTPYISKIVELCESPNRSVRVKALEILARCIENLPTDTIVGIVRKFTAETLKSSNEVLLAVSLLVQSAITYLAQKDAPILEAHFPEFLDRLLGFLTATDEDAVRTIKNIILYGIQAVSKQTLPPVIATLTSYLSIQHISVWPIIFEILSSLPAIIKEESYQALSEPVVSALTKLNTPDVQNPGPIVNFIGSVASQMGLVSFFSETQLVESLRIIDETGDIYNNLIFPILGAYKAKFPSDLQFTLDYIMPLEEFFHDVRNIYIRLWNVIPNCVTTDMEDTTEFAMFCFKKFVEHKELRRPITQILSSLAFKSASIMPELFSFILSPEADHSTITALVPTLIVTAQKNDVNQYIAEAIMKILDDSQSQNQRRALIDVCVGLFQYLNPDMKSGVFDLFLKLASEKNELQKKALRAIRGLYFQVPQRKHEIHAALSNAVTNTNERYKLLLMITMLETSEEEFSQLVTEYLPSFVVSLKDSGLKTRMAANEGIQVLGNEFMKRTGSIEGLIEGLVVCFVSDSSEMVSGALEAVITLLKKYYRNISVPLLNQLCDVVFMVSIEETETAKSMLKFAKVLIEKLTKFTGESQLPKVLFLAIACVKKANWEVKAKGHRMIEKCIEEYGIEKVTEAFPKEELKLLRGARKEVNREKRETVKEEKEKPHAFELDKRYDEEALDLLDTREVVQAKIVKEESMEDVEIGEDGRIVLQEVKKDRKKKAIKELESEDEDVGNEVNDYLAKKKKKAGVNVIKPPVKNNHQMKTIKKVEGKGVFAPLNSKLVNKRNRSQMKAEYRKIFKHAK